MSICAKTFNKTLANQIQQCIKRFYSKAKRDLYEVCEAGLTFKINVLHHINRPNKTDYMIIPIDTSKTFD